MKTKIVLFLLIAVKTVAGQQIIIRGQLGDSARVILSDMRKTDTVWTTNGHFQLARTFAGTTYSLSAFYPKQQRTVKQTFFPVDGTATFNGDTVLLSNNSLQKPYEQLNQKLEMLNRLRAELGSFYTANKPVTKTDLEGLNSMATTIADLKVALYKRTVAENKHNALGAYVLYRYLYNLPDQAQLDSLVKTIDPEVAKLSYPLQQLQKTLDIKTSLLPGHVPPELSGVDINGKLFRVASLKGKYVLLDFWGTWCVPCLSGLPKMKATYEKYKNKIAFVSIACHDKEKNWRATVAKQGMNWTQLLDDPKERIVRQFYVETFPTKILIGPDGKVVEVFSGEGDSFYTALDKLMR